jgi:hypothetical protein
MYVITKVLKIDVTEEELLAMTFPPKGSIYEEEPCL